VEPKAMWRKSQLIEELKKNKVGPTPKTKTPHTLAASQTSLEIGNQAIGGEHMQETLTSRKRANNSSLNAYVLTWGTGF